MINSLKVSRYHYWRKLWMKPPEIRARVCCERFEHLGTVGHCPNCVRAKGKFGLDDWKETLNEMGQHHSRSSHRGPPPPLASGLQRPINQGLVALPSMFSFETGLNISSVFCDLEPVTSCDYCALWSSRGLTHAVPSTQQPERCVDVLVWLKLVDINMTKKESKPRDCATPGVDLNGSDDGSSCNRPPSEEALCGTSPRRCSRLWSSPNCQEKK